ncbi:hypothetical protein [Candidatus Manganitrophus noduliformans]|uniref:Uncharacterized protein n=1 Tax=Candidatus Manganitrophus noduliformans TaxID=2606439 RepID=A0A7X6IBB3_9BACT|nr:hypothetical protein [Candidatus Manganitrophus noduliformans]NKE71606.1 hypothetical protein [Candidatus Manganitrophus noduliformans]
MKDIKTKLIVVFTTILLCSTDIHSQQAEELTAGEVIKRAINVVQMINIQSRSSEKHKREILKEIAVVQAKAGDRTGSKKIFGDLIDAIYTSGNKKDYPGEGKNKKMDSRILDAEDKSDAEDARNRGNFVLKIESLEAIAIAQIRAGFILDAKQTFGRMIQIATLIPNDDRTDGRAYILSRIAAAQAKSGNNEWASETIQMVLQVIDSAKTHSGGSPEPFKIFLKMDLTRTQLEIGEHLAAISAIQEAIQLASNLKDAKVKAFALRDIAMAQSRIGDRNGAVATIQKMIDTRRTIQDEEPNRILMFNLNDIAHIAESAAEFNRREDTENIINMIIRIMEANEDEEEAKSPAWRIIGEVRARLGDVEGALEAEKRIVSPIYRGTVLPAIVEAEIEAGNFKEARQLANMSLQRDILLKDIAISQARSGDIKEALSTVDSICCKAGTLIARSEAFRAIATARIISGEKKETLIWAENQPSPEEKAYTLLGLAEGLLNKPMNSFTH